MSTSKWRAQYRRFIKRGGRIFAHNQALIFSIFLQNRALASRKLAATGKSARGRAKASRYARTVRSKIVRKSGNRPKRYVVRDPEILGFRYNQDYLVEGLIPKFSQNYVEISKRLKNRSYTTIELKDFSFIDNPEGTLAQLRLVGVAAAQCIDVQLAFNDLECRDISAYIALALLMQKLPGVFSGGTITPEIAKVLSSVGLARRLGIGALEVHPGPRSFILPFRMKTRTQPRKFSDPHHQLRPQAKEKVADDFCSALEIWLGVHEIELSPEAQGSITETITEALDNAERHGWPDHGDGVGDWSVAGFSRLTVSAKGKISVECCFAILNVGETISESLDSAASEIGNLIGSYVNRHSSRYGTATLRTVMALQDGVTRIAAATEGRRGGLGLLALTQVVSELGGAGLGDVGSELSIVSGNSLIKIAHPYRCGIPGTAAPLKELWFNPNNCAKEAPDPNHVADMRENFPGTVIAARFSIDPAFLMKKISSNGIVADD